MTERAPNRRHTDAFKDQLCQEIRSGRIGRREASARYKLSDNLIHQWLMRFDLRSALPGPGAAHENHVDCLEKIRALERKIGELVMALEQHGCKVSIAPPPGRDASVPSAPGHDA